MNIAIIIGVSKYTDSTNNLPGCKNDAKAIHDILQKTDKFSPILYINENENSAKTKELITNFISTHKGSTVEELFFYYTGHGQFQGDDFYYNLSDFDPKKRKQTSLQNSEIDDLFRTLSAGLVVKVIDACQSGTTYIKENNFLVKYFDASQRGFKKCYFLNSSLNTQSSYQNEDISFFTSSFIRSMREHQTDDIRYKDIIDFISDEFDGNPEQTPFFVVQADYTEKFCTLSKSIRQFIISLESVNSIKKLANDHPLTLAELVKLEAKDYVDKEGAVQMLEIVRNEFKGFNLDPEIADLYKIEVKFLEDYQVIPHKRAIGNWIKQNANTYFANPTYETVEVLLPMPAIQQTSLAHYSIFGQSPNNAFAWNAPNYVEPEKQYVTNINGFDQKIDIPFKAISIDILGAYPNLTGYNCVVIFLLSKKNIRFFYFISNYIEQNWENKKVNTKGLEWSTTEQKITDSVAIQEAIKVINLKFQTKIQEDLAEKFKVVPQESDRLAASEAITSED